MEAIYANFHLATTRRLAVSPMLESTSSSRVSSLACTVLYAPHA